MTIRLSSRDTPPRYRTPLGIFVAGVIGLLTGLPTMQSGVGINSVCAAPPGAAAGRFGGGARANEVTKFTGTLKNARGNIIVVTRDDGAECMVQFPDEITSLTFVAEALPAYLRRGMPIRFATVLGQTGMPVSPVTKIEIFSPLSEQAVAASLKTKYMPGVKSSDRHKKRRRGAPLTGQVDVVGSLRMLTPQGGLALQAGETPFQTMVSPDAKIEIRYNNLSLAQPGDKVSVAGFYEPPDDTKVKASQITITTDRVYGEAPPKKGRQRGAKGKRNAKAEDRGAKAPEAEDAGKGDAAEAE